MVQRIRGRANGVGAALQIVKRGVGRAAGVLSVRRANVGDIGFNLDEVDLAMSPVSQRLLERFDYGDIRRRRVENYRRLAERLGGDAVPVFRTLPDGVCPLFFPVLVDDKHETAERLRARGVDALEFWNDSSEPGRPRNGPRRAIPAAPRPGTADPSGPDRASHRSHRPADVRPWPGSGCVMQPHAVSVTSVQNMEGFAALRCEWSSCSNRVPVTVRS